MNYLKKESGLLRNLLKCSDGYTLAESIISLVLLSAILLPLIWFFIEQEVHILSIEEQLRIERTAYQLLQSDEIKLIDSLRIEHHQYHVKWTQSEQLYLMELFDKQQKVYEKHFIR